MNQEVGRWPLTHKSACYQYYKSNQDLPPKKFGKGPQEVAVKHIHQNKKSTHTNTHTHTSTHTYTVHVHTKIDAKASHCPEGFGHDDGGGTALNNVDHEQGQGGQGRPQQLVPPAKVQHVVDETQEDHAADGEQSGYKLKRQKESGGKEARRV